MLRALLTLVASMVRSAINSELERIRPSWSWHFANSWPSTFTASAAAAVAARPSLLGLPLPVLAPLAKGSRRGSTRDRHSLAPQSVPRLLAMDLKTRTRSASDSRGDEGLDRPDGDRERLACRKIQAELSKLGIHLGLTTISRCLPKVNAGGDPHQRWMTFLRNHRDVIAGMDFFVVPTVRFTLLYVWFVLDHGRRRVLHFNVTHHPSARWVIQQLREAFPDHPAHRYLILDNDAIFSAEVVRAVARFRIHPQRTALQSPWQNGTAERFVGTVRRELLDHVVVLSEDHLRRLLREYIEYSTQIVFARRSAIRRPGARQKSNRRAEPRSSGSRAWAASMAATPGGTLLERADE